MKTLNRTLISSAMILWTSAAFASNEFQKHPQGLNEQYNARISDVEGNSEQISSVRGVQVHIDHQFTTENYVRLLNSAARKFIGVAWDGGVLDCAFDKVRYDTPSSRNKFVQDLRARLGHADKVFLLRFSESYNDDPGDWTGILGLGRLDTELNAVGINHTALLAFWSRVNSFEQRANWVAGVVGHEILHNMGLGADRSRHKTGNDFVYRYGNCVTLRLEELRTGN